jgi:hypothetical protein
VILAMAAGRRGARAIGAWLQQGKAVWPVELAAAEAFAPTAAVAESLPNSGDI